MATRLPHSDDHLLKPREAAMIFGVRPATLSRWARAGRLAWILTPGGHRRYRWAEIRKIIEANDSFSDSSQ